MYMLGTHSNSARKKLFLPSLNEHGVFIYSELKEVQAFPPPPGTDSIKPWSFRYLGALLQRAFTDLVDAWSAQREENRKHQRSYLSISPTLSLSPEESALALSCHLIPKACFVLSKALFDLDLLEDIRRMCSTCHLASIGATDTKPTSATASLISSSGHYAGFGTPDPLTWVFRALLLDLLTALNEPVDSAFHQAFAVPLKHIHDFPQETTSFPTFRNLSKLMTRFSISLHFGHPSQVHVPTITISKRAQQMSALSSLPQNLLFRALNAAQHEQIHSAHNLSNPPNTFGPPSPLPLTLSDIRDIVDKGSFKPNNSFSLTRSPYVMCRYALGALGRFEESTVALIDITRLRGPIFNLTSTSSRKLCNLSNRGEALASKDQETVIPAQPISPLSIAPASLVTEGLSAQTAFGTFEQNLTDSAIETLYKLIPPDTLTLPRPETDPNSLSIHCDGSLCPPSSQDLLSNHIEPRTLNFTAAPDTLTILKSNAAMILNDLTSGKQVSSWLFANETTSTFAAGWNLCTITMSTTRLPLPHADPFKLFPVATVSIRPIEVQLPRTQTWQNATPRTLATFLRPSKIQTDYIRPSTVSVLSHFQQIILHLQFNPSDLWPLQQKHPNLKMIIPFPLPKHRCLIEKFSTFRSELHTVLSTLGSRHLVAWLNDNNFPNPPKVLTQIAELALPTSSQSQPQQNTVPFSNEVILILLWDAATAVNPPVNKSHFSFFPDLPCHSPTSAHPRSPLSALTYAQSPLPLSHPLTPEMVSTAQTRSQSDESPFQGSYASADATSPRKLHETNTSLQTQANTASPRTLCRQWPQQLSLNRQKPSEPLMEPRLFSITSPATPLLPPNPKY